MRQKTSKKRAKIDQEEVEKGSGGHFWASGAALRATLGAPWPPEGPQVRKGSANPGYRTTSEGPFLDKNRKKTMKNVKSWSKSQFY